VTGGLDLRRRFVRAARVAAYLLLSVPLALLCALALAALVVCAALSLVWIGLPLLLGVAGVLRALAGLERTLSNRLLVAHVPPIPPRVPRAGSAWRRTVTAFGDPGLRRVLALAAVKLPLTVATLAAGLVPIALTAGLVVLGMNGIAGIGDVTYLGPLRIETVGGLLLLGLAFPAAVVAIAVLGGLRWVLVWVVRPLLSPRSATEGPVREMLAESLGDRTLSIAYWLPDRETFVDEAGRAVELPHPGSGRAWTAVERDGRRVAAIVHDAELDTGPELVHAAAAAAALAIDNERLKADLRARVEELRVSRVRIVEAADGARRRLERDLHDGAQQQLVSLALDLRLLRARLADAEAEALVDQLSAKLADALAELRELARGIHPAILTERGLGPALEGLAGRAPLPVELTVDVPGRLSTAIEAAAYFVVAEALTNIVRYANATFATVDVRRDGDDLRVEVRDDGIGGASLARGSGLRGLTDRLSALDGTLTLESPPGEGTRLLARVPCSARSLVTEAQS